MRDHKNRFRSESGFSLIELMVALVLGLFATLVIMQTFSSFEGQKRSTSGVADAQTNGSIALMNIQRHVQLAGYGLPLPNADLVNNSLRCDPVPSYDPDNDPLTLNSLGFSPIELQDGAATTDSDTLTVRYGASAAGAVPVSIIDASSATAAIGMNVVNNIGCKDDDIALIYNGTACKLVKIKDANGSGNTTDRIALEPSTALGGPIVDNAQMACMGNWQDYAFSIANDELQLNGGSIISDIVMMQAQYGVSGIASSNQVNAWVDAKGGTWLVPSVTDRNRIKAVRVAIVVRNGLLEKTPVSQACNGAVAGLTNICIWNSDAAPQAVDLSGTPNWNRYRYRVFETIIPLRNMLWSKDAVS